MPNQIKFGTDGWRAVIAEEFTFDNVRACAQGLADYLKQAGLAERGLVIGYDTRFASEDFAAAAAEVAAGNGIKAIIAPEAAPTPVISYAVPENKAGGAIIITASHNPHQYNGFKFKNKEGSSAPDDVTAQIEKLVATAQESGDIKRLPMTEGLASGLIAYQDLDTAYFKQMAKLVDLEALKKSGLKVAVDPMYGAGAGYLEKLLGGDRLKINEIHGVRNPLFPGLHPEPIAKNLEGLIQTVKDTKANVGLATDGDADRMGIVDENGRFLTQLQVYALLCLYLLEIKKERGAIIKTVTTTSMTYRLGELFDVPVVETKVGFKYVAPAMTEHNAIIGGEESGGYGFRGHVLERDGLLANLYFLELMVKTGKTPSELINYVYSKVGPHHYRRIDLKFNPAERQNIIDRVKASNPANIAGQVVDKRDAKDGFRFFTTDGSWLLVRFSGTEPVLRVYAETESVAQTEAFLKEGQKLAGV
ncbi:phosphoglucomutase/phosphomannomutase family protein [Chloroflexota bacterium]